MKSRSDEHPALPRPTLPSTTALSLSCGSVTESRDIFVKFGSSSIHFGMTESLGQLQLDMGSRSNAGLLFLISSPPAPEVYQE